MVAHYTAILNVIQGENRQESISSWYASHTKEVVVVFSNIDVAVKKLCLLTDMNGNLTLL